MNSPEIVATDWQNVQRLADGVIKPMNVPGEPQNVSGAVISAFEEVDRGQFVLSGKRPAAKYVYGDEVIPLTEGSAISQPHLMAQMITLLGLEGHERVLELGTATGYQAALLSRIAASVDTIEINPALARQARANLKRLNITNVTAHEGDGAKGLKEAGCFDAIIVTAHIKEIPPALIGQLAVGGRLVAPVGTEYRDATLVRFTKAPSGKMIGTVHGGCYFVPCLSKERGGWTLEKWEEARQRQV